MFLNHISMRACGVVILMCMWATACVCVCVRAISVFV